MIFPVDLTPGNEQTIYLRVRSEGSLTVPITLWSPSALYASDQITYSVMLVFWHVAGIGTVQPAALLSLRDRIYLSYVGAFGMILAQLSMFGLGNQFLWPDSPVWGNIALPGSFCLTGYFRRAIYPAIPQHSTELAGVRPADPRPPSLLCTGSDHTVLCLSTRRHCDSDHWVRIFTDCRRLRPDRPQAPSARCRNLPWRLVCVADWRCPPLPENVQLATHQSAGPPTAC